MIVYVPGVSVLVLTVALNVPCGGLNGPPIVTGDNGPMVTVPVPLGTLLFPAFSLPDTEMLAVPWVIVCEGEGFRLLNAGCRLRTFVKVVVVFIGRFGTPLVAVTLAVNITVVPPAAVSL